MAFRVVVLPAPLLPRKRDDPSPGHLEGDPFEHLDDVGVDHADVVELEQDFGLHVFHDFSLQ